MLLAKARGETYQTKAAMAPAKLRRVKAYINMNNLANMCRQYGVDFSKFFIKADPITGELPDPFSWAHVNLCTDRASDEVAELFALIAMQANCHKDFDPPHGTSTVGKGALKDCGLWNHEVVIRFY